MPKNATDYQSKIDLRKLLREGALKHAVRDLEIAREWEEAFFDVNKLEILLKE